MIPWRAKEIQSAFVLALLGVSAATQGYLAHGVPLWAAGPGLFLAGAFAFGGALLWQLGWSLGRNRVRRAVRSGREDVRRLCAEFLRLNGRAWRAEAEGSLFLDDPAPPSVQDLRRALAGRGVWATAGEVMQYLLLCPAAGGRRTVRVPDAGPRRRWAAGPAA